MQCINCINCMLCSSQKSGRAAQRSCFTEINVERPASCSNCRSKGWWSVVQLRRVIRTRRGVLAERASIPCNIFHLAQHCVPNTCTATFSFNQEILFAFSRNIQICCDIFLQHTSTLWYKSTIVLKLSGPF